MKNIWLMVVGLIIILVGGYFLFIKDSSDGSYVKPEETIPGVVVETETPEVTPATEEEIAEINEVGPVETIGKSADGNDIVAYHFGKGSKELMFVAGSHGGYSYNTALLAFELVDWFEANPDKIPTDVKVTIIPVLNPDGLKEATGKTGRFSAADVSKDEKVRISGRFNANNVDINRNFACEWQATGTWQNQAVSGGTAAFSEPESQAMQNYIQNNVPEAVVTWYSAAGGVYSSECRNGVLPETLALTNLFAKASGYKAYAEFDYYEITGDMVNWLASQKIPAISVLLTDRVQTEFSKNIAGVEAMLKQYSN
jgi:hypothetical protein